MIDLSTVHAPDEPNICGKSYDHGYEAAMRGEVYECQRAPGHDGACGRDVPNDCPHGDPMHDHGDGCPSCDIEQCPACRCIRAKLAPGEDCPGCADRFGGGM